MNFSDFIYSKNLVLLAQHALTRQDGIKNPGINNKRPMQYLKAFFKELFVAYVNNKKDVRSYIMYIYIFKYVKQCVNTQRYMN